MSSVAMSPDRQITPSVNPSQQGAFCVASSRSLVLQHSSTFTCFPRLPIELQIRIWKAAILPRNISLSEDLSIDSPDRDGYRLGNLPKLKALQANLVLMGTCAISRAECLKEYELVFEGILSNGPIYINWGRDTLQFESERDFKIFFYSNIHHCYSCWGLGFMLCEHFLRSGGTEGSVCKDIKHLLFAKEHLRLPIHELVGFKSLETVTMGSAKYRFSMDQSLNDLQLCKIQWMGYRPEDKFPEVIWVDEGEGGNSRAIQNEEEVQVAVANLSMVG